MTVEARSIHPDFASPRPLMLQLARPAMWCAAVAFPLLGLFLVVRKVVGGDAYALAAPAILVTAVLTATAASLLRWGWRWWSSTAGADRGSHLFYLLTSAAVLLMGIACSAPRTSLLATTGLWLILVGEELVWLIAMVREGTVPQFKLPRRWRTNERVAPAPEHSPVSSPADGVREFCDESLEANEPLLPDGVTQQWTRGRDASGEFVMGLLRAELASGERTATLHVGFCPPLPDAPRVTVRQLEGPACHLKLGEAHPYGARVELRLQRVADEPVEVIVQLQATERPAGPEAGGDRGSPT